MLALRGVFAFFLAAFWEPVRLLNGASWSWYGIIWRFLILCCALYLSYWASTRRGRRLVLCACLTGLLILSSWWGARHADTLAAWMALGSLYAILLNLETAFSKALQQQTGWFSRLEYGGGLLSLVAFGGIAPAVLAQVEAQFAEEEFYVAVQIALLGLFCLLLLLVQALARRWDSLFKAASFGLRPLWVVAGLGLIGLAAGFWGIRLYQSSFYAAAFAGNNYVSADNPFLCASITPAPGKPDGQTVFGRIQKLIEANPNKSTSEYGMLALVTGQQEWAARFRESILSEASARRFTEPANSIKYGQRLAAQRAYYFARIREDFANLFTAEELSTIERWFADINQRAMTVEWVDLLYGLAFDAWPEGPYENQENGAGLLSLLETFELSDKDLSAANQSYLDRNVRGWVERYRNTDDAYLYQTEWIENAYFQSLYQATVPDPMAYQRNQRLSFDWLLLQALPGGVPLTYNRPGAVPVANTLYLGALLLDDPRYLWVADQSLRYWEARAGYLFAQPGLEQVVQLSGVAPTQGTCLLYSPTGLPTQVGPLSSDKIVFRDGWAADATFMLLNLRFTGWHRYKGTNSVVSLYHGGPVVVEETAAPSAGWLPEGRSLFRDKRVPRENLNGLLIPRTGFGQVVYMLGGLNGPWAQDPPHLSTVEDFFLLGLLDASRTAIKDWRGWDHHRTIYFFHQGPIIIIDDADGPGGGQSALTWHLAGLGEQAPDGLWLRRGDTPVRMAVPDTSWVTSSVTNRKREGSERYWEYTYAAPDSGRLDLVTTFLTDGWATARYDVEAIQASGVPVGHYIQLSRETGEIRVLHNSSPYSGSPDLAAVVTAPGMSTDGLALIVLGHGSGSADTVCRLGGTQASLSLAAEPSDLLRRDNSQRLQRETDWLWADGTLELKSTMTSGCVEIVH